MARFTVRVELHGASTLDYERLHLAMAQFGALRTITSDQGTRYALPTAEYNVESNVTSEQVLASAQVAAAQTGKASAIIVTEALKRSWFGLAVVSIPPPPI